MSRTLYAHTQSGSTDKSGWELLDHHLRAVERKASAFAGAFGAAEWGAALGACHDLGKASDEFQKYLEDSSAAEAEDASEDRPGLGRVDHSTYGARYAHRTLGPIAGKMLAFCIAGHHAGLPDWSSEEDGARATLKHRLSESYWIPAAADPPFQRGAPALPKLAGCPNLAFSIAFFTRMLFSALIDADRLCTEEFASPEQAGERLIERPDIDALHLALSSYLNNLQRTSRDTPVNRQRRNALAASLTAAHLDPGFFSLQVPTGGGKTFSSLLFALEHARLKQKRRVIVAIPFTSIIEQTADVYRRALGDLAKHGLIEHHTNIQPERETRANKLGTENWDAPLVVTTNVQVFESLFAARTTPCRKLHNLANSVIILDEAQTIPVELLQPTLAALRELVRHFGCSVVLCTATQPALQHRDDFKIGLEGVRSIIPDPLPLFAALRRVEVKRAGALHDVEIVGRLAVEPQVLCIVNTRPHAAALYRALLEQTDSSGEASFNCFHLSTLMCGAHRRSVLKMVREHITDTSKPPCRVVSTQLVEAGVDLDFPVVYRAAAGLDSIAQAAGRCNREGLLPIGTTYVFETAEQALMGFLEQARQAGSEIFDRPEYGEDPLAPAAIEAYFRLLYWGKRDDWDKKAVMPCFQLDQIAKDLLFQFREAADRYRIIEDTQIPILVPYDAEATKMRDLLQNGHVEFVAQRNLQPYLVSIPRHAHDRMVAEHVVQPHPSGVSLLLRRDVYDDQMGLKLDGFGLDARAWAV